MKFSECKDVFALLSQYLDQELPDDVCSDIESHIAGCAPCVEFVESLKKSIQLTHDCEVSAAAPAPLPEPARQELLAAYKKMLEAREAG